MPYAPFDPTRAVTFDLSSGQVHLQDSQTTVIVPASALAELCSAAGEQATARFGRAIGQAMGKRVASRLGGPEQSRTQIESSTVEGFVEHLGGEFALAGMGTLSLERWGRALVLVLDRGSSPSALLCALLESALEAATGRAVRCLRIMQEDLRERFAVTNPEAATRAQAWLAEGASWGEVLVKLHAPHQAPQPRGDA
jgi:hypothetical protein